MKKQIGVLLDFDPVWFYQQKMLLIDIQTKLNKEYHSHELFEMTESIIELYDEIGDQAEDLEAFTYPIYDETKNGFSDDRYNNVLAKLTAQPAKEA